MMSIKRVWRSRPEPDYYWVYDIWIGGRRVRTPRGEAFPTKEECKDAVSSIRTDYRRGKYQFPADQSTIKIGELREAWVAEQKSRGRVAKHIERVERILRQFERALSPGLTVAAVESEHIKKYFLKRIGEGLKRESAATEVGVIMAALNGAPTVIKSLKDWRPPRKPKEIVTQTSGRERVITRDEEALIIETIMLGADRVRKQDARIFWFALRTGMREGEIIGLLKTSVCFERAIKMEYGWIEVRRSLGSERTKTGHTRIIPMSKTVAAMLGEQMAQAEKSIYVFPGKGVRRRSEHTFIHRFKAACELARIPYGRAVAGGLVFHDSRHTAATRMLHAGNDLKTVGTILGHSDEYMTLKYAHATPASRQAAVSALEDEDFGVRFESPVQSKTVHSVPFRPKEAKG